MSVGGTARLCDSRKTRKDAGSARVATPLPAQRAGTNRAPRESAQITFSRGRAAAGARPSGPARGSAPQALQPAAPGEAMLRCERHRRAALPAPARRGWKRRDTAVGYSWPSAREPSGARLPSSRPPQPVSRPALNERPGAPARGARPGGKGQPGTAAVGGRPSRRGRWRGEEEEEGSRAHSRRPQPLPGTAACAPRPLSLNSGTAASRHRAAVPHARPRARSRSRPAPAPARPSLLLRPRRHWPAGPVTSP